ncbi:MAG: 3,4-dihydroxyphthalate decarboxylase [Chloroflexota bacterium]|jgi:ribulose-5-phosphate 4-epimerase/fuculose-1-phosphate aldolase|nr:3,4-dihydroxyphthalate decarboxylase [Chloroflexota bacterium]
MARVAEHAQVDRYQLDHLREIIATSCRILAQHGLVTGSTGHVSHRVPGTDDILVRGRPHVDKGLRFAEPSSIIRVGPDAIPVGDNTGVARVSEIYLHTEVYKRRPEVNAVIHAHPPGAVLCTINNVPLRPIFGGFNPGAASMAGAGVPIYDRSITLQTVEETLPMVDALGQKDVILLSRHGILVTGRSVEEATSRALTLETLARMNWIASRAGDPGEILDVDKETFASRNQATAEARAAGRNRYAELHPGAADGDRRGNWDYLTALLETGAVYFDDLGMGFRM